MHIIKSSTNFGLYFLFYLPIALQQKFATFLVINILIQFLLCGWSLAMREHLPSSVEIYIDDSFVEFLDKFSRTKVDNLHLWNRMQSQVTLTYTHIHTYFHTSMRGCTHTYIRTSYIMNKKYILYILGIGCIHNYVCIYIRMYRKKSYVIFLCCTV